MISLTKISKVYGSALSRRAVLVDVDALFEPNQHYVIFGVRGSGKTTLLRVMSGVTTPTRGTVRRRGTVSIPVGAASGFAGDKTPRELASFLASLYEVESREVVRFVTEFSGLGEAMDLPVTALSASKRAFLSYSLGYAIPCDYYLFDDNVAYGPDAARDACLSAFAMRRKSSATIVATRETRNADAFGDRGGVLHGGRLFLFETIQEALEVYRGLELESQGSGRSYARLMAIREGPQAAYDYLRRHLDGNAEGAEAYELLANLALRVGKPSDAVVAATVALTHGSTSPEMDMILAKGAESRGDMPEAIRHAESVLRKVPQHRDARVIIARCHDRLRNHGEAASIWTRLADPGAALRSYMRAENWEGALGTVDLLLSDKPSDGRLLLTRARALIELKRWSQVPEAIEQIAAVQPEETLSLVYRVVRSEDVKAIAIVMSGLGRLELSEYRQTRIVDLILRLLERNAASAAAAGRLADCEELHSFIFRVDPERSMRLPKPEQRASLGSQEMGRSDQGKPSLGTAEDIVRELYDLRIKRGQVEAKEFDERSRAAWGAAKALVKRGGEQGDSADA
jgi:capsular polysaccharide transport system ATP-binding protein